LSRLALGSTERFNNDEIDPYGGLKAYGGLMITVVLAAGALDNINIDSQTVFSIINAMILAAAAVAAIWQLRKLAEQARLTVFTAYTQRYSNIMAEIPESAFDPINSILSAKDLTPEIRNKYLSSMRLFFNLCSEEFYLHQQKLLDEKVWVLWRKGLEYHMRFPSYQDAWKVIGNHEGYDDDFKVLVSRAIPPTCKIPSTNPC
jgi:hypothetical protein